MEEVQDDVVVCYVKDFTDLKKNEKGERIDYGEKQKQEESMKRSNFCAKAWVKPRLKMVKDVAEW